MGRKRSPSTATKCPIRLSERCSLKWHEKGPICFTDEFSLTVRFDVSGPMAGCFRCVAWGLFDLFLWSPCLGERDLEDDTVPDCIAHDFCFRGSSCPENNCSNEKCPFWREGSVTMDEKNNSQQTTVCGEYFSYSSWGIIAGAARFCRRLFLHPSDHV